MDGWGRQRNHTWPGPSDEPPEGQIEYPLPDREDGWHECLRDLSRTMQGGGVFLIGRRAMNPLSGIASTSGDVGSSARDAAFDLLCGSIRDELTAQGLVLSPAGELRRLPPRTADASPSVLPRTRLSSPFQNMSWHAIQELGRQVAIHISIGPGIQVAMQGELPPTLWQPAFVVCIGCNQVRVVTFAFVGEPVAGDRPDRKYTPWVLRLVSGDLVADARPRAGGARNLAATASEKGQPPSSPVVRPLTRAQRRTAIVVEYLTVPASEDVELITDHVENVEEELFDVVEHGNWSIFVTKPVPRHASRESAETDSSRSSASDSSDGDAGCALWP